MTRGFDQLAGELRGAEQRRTAAARRPGRARSLLLPLVTTAVVLAVLTVVLLTGTGPRHPARPGGPPSGSPAPGTGLGRGHWRLSCSDFVGHTAPAHGMRVVLGAVALPGRPGESRALQTGRDGARLVAKSGLWIRSGARFQLIVPTALRDRLKMTWGDAGEGNHGVAMTDPGCRVGDSRWLNYVGGYWVTHPLCATLIVVADGRRRRIRIGIGTPCAGQRPPAMPSQS
jgi:hypothetical protein